MRRAIQIGEGKTLRPVHIICAVLTVLLAIGFAGCAGQAESDSARGEGPALAWVDLSESTRPVRLQSGELSVSAARNEVVSVCIRVRRQLGDPSRLTFGSWIAPGGARATRSASPEVNGYQVLPVVCDLNQAQYICRTGDVAAARPVPRVLLPLATSASSVDVNSLRDSSEHSALLWFDLRIPAAAPAGNYHSTISLGRPQDHGSVQLSIQLEVNDLVLPQRSRLKIVGDLKWNDLRRLWPAALGTLDPQFLSRGDARDTRAIHLLDQLIAMAHQNRVFATASELSPIVKWPPDATPTIDWNDFDQLVKPWLSGSAFSDATPPAYWPLPQPPLLQNLDQRSQHDYARLAAAHFTGRGWIAAPMSTANEVDPAGEDSLGTAGADAADTRSLAWLAFLRRENEWRWPRPLPPADLAQSAPADDAAWFYPGQSFGVDRPLETLALKWARSAEQDWEVLNLLSQNGHDALVRRTATLIAKPIMLTAQQQQNPVLALVCNGSSASSLDTARSLLTQAVHQPARAPISDLSALTDPAAVRWGAAVEHPLLLLRQVSWIPDEGSPATPANLRCRLAVAAFDPAAMATPAAATPAGSLQWLAAPAWQVNAEPVKLPVKPAALIPGELDGAPQLPQAAVSNRRVDAAPTALAALFTSGLTGQTTTARWMLPVATSVRRREPLSIDGSLADWFPDDALQLQRPLVRMLGRATAQSGQLAVASTASSIYSCWSDDDFYLAFRLADVRPNDGRRTHNFVTYQLGRAWGEDLAEVLIQPLSTDGAAGPLLHVVVKPAGQWVERWDERTKSWKPIASAAIRIASSVDPAQHVWRAEMAIPWEAILNPGQPRPPLLRFNFAQHKQSTGESASWAGPVDNGRDSGVMGAIVLTENDLTAPAAGVGSNSESGANPAR